MDNINTFYIYKNYKQLQGMTVYTHTPVVVDIDDSSQGFPDAVVYDSIHANSD